MKRCWQLLAATTQLELTYKTEALSSQHDRSDFDCGVASLNKYLKTQAKQDQKRRVSACFVFCEEQSVLAYYTLSSASVGLDELPAKIQKKLPRYPRVPATLMGRLAVDRTARGRRLGERLLFDGLFRALDASQAVASHAVLLDALDVDPDPIPFYEQYGFQRMSEGSRTLFLPMATIVKVPRV